MLPPRSSIIPPRTALMESNMHVAMISMVMHELPASAHREMLEAMIDATAVRRGDVWIVDIHPAYVPSASFLSGEPYAIEYLQTFETTLRSVTAHRPVSISYVDIFPSHVRLWILSHVDDGAGSSDAEPITDSR